MENNLSIVQDKFKELPNNIEAEQSVIGSILVTNEIFDEISTIISSTNFYDPIIRNANFFPNQSSFIISMENGCI